MASLWEEVRTMVTKATPAEVTRDILDYVIKCGPLLEEEYNSMLHNWGFWLASDLLTVLDAGKMLHGAGYLRRTPRPANVLDLDETPEGTYFHVEATPEGKEWAQSFERERGHEERGELKAT